MNKAYLSEVGALGTRKSALVGGGICSGDKGWGSLRTSSFTYNNSSGSAVRRLNLSTGSEDRCTVRPELLPLTLNINTCNTNTVQYFQQYKKVFTH